MKFKISGTFTGKRNMLSNGTESAITKIAKNKIILRKDFIEGDEVANETYHGGAMRVIHHYPYKHYQSLKENFSEISDRFIPGSFGENIITEELTEEDLSIGDTFILGTAKVQLTVCRRPCATINYAYGDNRILKFIMETGKTGWFYRVLEEGEVRVGDDLILLERPFPDLVLAKLHEQGYEANRFSNKEFLERCLKTGLLDKAWKIKIENALGI